MGDPVELTDLPTEVVVEILRSELISCEDLYSVGDTCRYLRQAASTTSLWMNKMCKKWPDLEPYRKRSSFSWFKEYKNLISMHTSCEEKITRMSPHYYWAKVSLSDCHMQEFLDMCKMYEGLGLLYLLIFLKDLCSKEIQIEDVTPHLGLYNMTNQHYATIVLDFINQHLLRKKWSEMCSNLQILTPEKVALFFDQWMEPKHDEFDAEFDTAMSNIAENIISFLPNKHPLCQIKEEEKKKWSDKLIANNQYDAHSCRDVIKLACEVLKTQERLLSNDDPTSNSLIIRNVINEKQSNRYYSAIILEAVLRRCGIRCDVVYFPNHRLLLWRENWVAGSPSYLVNPCTGEMKSSMRRCPFAFGVSSPEPDFYFYSPLNLLLNLGTCMRDIENGKIKRTLKRALELLSFLEPEDAVHCFLLGELYLDLKKDTQAIEDNLISILERQTLTVRLRERAGHVLHQLRKANEVNQDVRISKYKKTIKHRTKNIKFAVGLICYHKVYGYLCVLHGWDPICLATNEWKINMGVHNLSFGDKQPFYHVLAIDFTERYVAQENLVCVYPSQRLACIEEKLAMSFSHFNGYFYVPNTEKNEEYPDDSPVRLSYRAGWR